MTWLPKRRVLVPTDFSQPFMHAFNTAREFVARNGELHVLYVVPPLENTSPSVLLGTVDESTRANSAHRYLDDFLEQNEIQNVIASVEVGDAGTKIAEYTASHNIDLVVIPSHGNHGLQRLLLGSVAERVVRFAECPVLVLRTTEA